MLFILIPIYRVSLNEDQQQKAKSALCNVTICIKRLQEVQEEKNTSEHIVSDETSTIPITTISIHFSESSEDEYEKLLDIEEFSRKLRLVQEKGQGSFSSLYTIFHNFK